MTRRGLFWLAALLLPPALSAQAREFWSGRFDVRNRTVSGVGGSGEVYRSVVNLGDGPRLFDSEVRLENPGSDYIDRGSLRADGWGGDPWSVVRLDAQRSDLYELDLDIRNLAYFNALPSFANPLLDEGLLLNQRALDVTRRQIDVELRLLPHRLIAPYVGFYRADGSGRGVTTFVTDGDEFPVRTDLDDDLTSFRGGVRLGRRDWRLTLEQGRTDFEDDQRVFHDGASIPGNRRDDARALDQLDEIYEANGRGLFSRIALQASPWERLRLTGQLLWSQPELDVETRTVASGVFVERNLRPYFGLVEQNLADALRPRTSGSWAAELQVTGRLRLVQSWMTDRFHVSSGSTLSQLLEGPAADAAEAVSRTLSLDYSQHQIDAVFDWRRWLTVRAGHRYVWGEAETPPPTLELSPSQAEVRRHVGLASASMRAGRWRWTADLEASPSETTFFRTGLRKYWKGRTVVRYELGPNWTVSGSFAALENRNDDPQVDYDFRSRRASGSLYWQASERLSLLADYSWLVTDSDIRAIDLPTFNRIFYDYRDRGHHGSALADLTLPRNWRLRLGGALSTNSGSRPTDYWQPQAELEAPLAEGFAFVGEWRWYGFDVDFLRLENFRAHAVSLGLAWEF